MGDVAYVSRRRIERVRGPLRRALFPAGPGPVLFGVRAAIGRAFEHRMERCPVYRSIRAAIEVTTDLDVPAS